MVSSAWSVELSIAVVKSEEVGCVAASAKGVESVAEGDEMVVAIGDDVMSDVVSAKVVAASRRTEIDVR